MAEPILPDIKVWEYKEELEVNFGHWTQRDEDVARTCGILANDAMINVNAQILKGETPYIDDFKLSCEYRDSKVWIKIYVKMSNNRDIIYMLQGDDFLTRLAAIVPTTGEVPVATKTGTFSFPKKEG